MNVKKALASVSASLLLVAGLLITPSVAQAVDNRVPAERVGVDSVSQPQWVAPGKHIQYPYEGGTWEYGFWNAKYRSYYTVNKCHGTTVKSGKRKLRSVDTASGKKSIAELWAVNNPGANPQYYYRVC